jgi:hypothetical protein
LFSIGRSAHFEPDRFAQQRLEWGEVPVRGPHFQLRVAGGVELQEEIVATIAQLESGDDLRMTAVEALRNAQDCRQQAYGTPKVRWQLRIFLL